MNTKGKVLVTGSNGFIGGYIVEELIRQGYTCVGLDNFSKYGKVKKSFEGHPSFTQVEADAIDETKVYKALEGCDHLIAGAAMIGGISYFHTYAYDLLATNEKIMAGTIGAAIKRFKEGQLKKVTYMSSSMVFESTNKWPSEEGDELSSPPPLSSYGFQKLAVEYFARAAFSQHGLPYTILRPFNCVGIGESRALGDETIMSGNVALAMSHVVPDLVQKILRGQDPLRILGEGNQIRHYTYGGDLARGVVTSLDHANARNEDFNLSTADGHTVLEVAAKIWRKIHGDDKPFRFVTEDPFDHDVQKRIPSVAKAKELLGFEATTSLDESLDEIIPWIEDAMDKGLI